MVRGNRRRTCAIALCRRGRRCVRVWMVDSVCSCVYVCACACVFVCVYVCKCVSICLVCVYYV